MKTMVESLFFLLVSLFSIEASPADVPDTHENRLTAALLFLLEYRYAI